LGGTKGRGSMPIGNKLTSCSEQNKEWKTGEELIPRQTWGVWVKKRGGTRESGNCLWGPAEGNKER